jgi:hypothetical protein
VDDVIAALRSGFPCKCSVRKCKRFALRSLCQCCLSGGQRAGYPADVMSVRGERMKQSPPVALNANAPPSRREWRLASTLLLGFLQLLKLAIKQLLVGLAQGDDLHHIRKLVHLTLLDLLGKLAIGNEAALHQQ